jgi:crotonobetainyl-CoA:carnitine CoA-transferase CaiB-like acyl-CoA transferase
MVFMGGALTGIRIIEAASYVTGPFASQLLSDLGAEVIKVEEPTRGDETRQWGPPWAGEGEAALSAYYVCVNRNKKDITLNLKHPQGQALARRLVQQSQVVIENFKPGGMSAYGLGYEDLSALNPALVYCSITGFGQSGSYSERPGYDFVIQAMSGLMSITGPADGAPHKVGVAVTDVLAGLYAAASILAALRHAEQTGQGQYLDVSLLDVSLASLVNVASNALISGQTPGRYGNAHPNIVPYQTFHAADQDFALAVGNDRQFAALCKLIERPEWAQDERYATNPARVRHRDSLIEDLQAIFVQRPAADWVESLLALDIPCGLVNDVSTILRDPHVAARGLVQQVALANDTRIEVVGHPVKFSRTPPQIHSAPPLHGADTDDLLCTLLDLSEDEIDQLHRGGVI